MSTHDLLTSAIVQRKAIVYVRQSAPQQVQANLESPRRQYKLVEVARRRGFDVGLTLDPDERLREVIKIIFQKFRELGSARQVLLWMASATASRVL
jgi:acetylornithine/succinyldiaminopimelate/putrescine aminotransferase